MLHKWICFNFFLCLCVKFHKSVFWVPILAAGVPIGSLFHEKLGPYFKAWGSLLVFASCMGAFLLASLKALRYSCHDVSDFRFVLYQFPSPGSTITIYAV